MSMRWLYHIIAADTPVDIGEGSDFAPGSLATEGFVHCSYRPAVLETARLYFAQGAKLDVLKLDPRRIAARIEEAHTPRGPMPHVHGPIPAAAICARMPIAEIEGMPDALAP